MRGFLFELSEAPDNLGDMDADSFINTNDGGSFAEWYEDTKLESVDSSVIEELKHVNMYHSSDEKNSSPYLLIDDSVRKKYFAKRFLDFHKQSINVSMNDFISGSINEIQRIIEDNYGDAVYLTESQYALSFDRFVREAEDNRKYYIGNVILMH